jgi:hypothetical protein
MPRKPTGDRALTPAERQARKRAAQQRRLAAWRAALERIAEAPALTAAELEMRAIAAEALHGERAI